MTSEVDHDDWLIVDMDPNDYKQAFFNLPLGGDKEPSRWRDS